MEDHPIMFFFLVVVYALKAIYCIVLVLVKILVAIYKWMKKKIKERWVKNNVAN